MLCGYTAFFFIGPMQAQGKENAENAAMMPRKAGSQVLLFVFPAVIVSCIILREEAIIKASTANTKLAPAMQCSAMCQNATWISIVR